jgi:hypothetical protein
VQQGVFMYYKITAVYPQPNKYGCAVETNTVNNLNDALRLIRPDIVEVVIKRVII